MIVSSGGERRSFRDIEIMDKRRLTIIDIITTSENRASGKKIIHLWSSKDQLTRFYTGHLDHR